MRKKSQMLVCTLLNFVFHAIIQQTNFLIVDNSNDETERIFVEKHFLGLLEKDKKLSAGIAAIKTLLMVLEKTNCKFFKKKTSTVNTSHL